MSKKKNIEKLIWLLSAACIIAAWFVGRIIEQNTSLEQIKEKLSIYSEIEQIAPQNFIAYESLGQKPIAYISEGEGIGYGGKLSVLVAMDTLANIQSISLIKQKETHSFLKKVINKGFISDYRKLNLHQIYEFENFPDAVSGATLTSQGIHHAIVAAVAVTAKEQFNTTILIKNEKKLIVGLPEVVLILLYGIAFFLNTYKTKRAKLIRWFAMISSIIFIGFIARKMLTLSQIGGFILAFWPSFYEFSFWYILLFGLVLGILINGKNHYCDWVCPFGHVQELLGKIGKSKTPKLKFRNQLKWGQRFLALTAIVLGLIYRNPSKMSYEIFSGFFVFTGSDILFIALALIIILSLFINKPWCNYVCPIKPSIDYFRKFREILLKK